MSDPENIVVVCQDIRCLTRYVTCKEAWARRANRCPECDTFKAARVDEKVEDGDQTAG